MIYFVECFELLRNFVSCLFISVPVGYMLVVSFLQRLRCCFKLLIDLCVCSSFIFDGICKDSLLRVSRNRHVRLSLMTGSVIF